MIPQLQLKDLFSDAFDTFKAFDGLIADESGNDLLKAKVPTTIWQILNHLIAFNSHQLKRLADPLFSTELNEDDTWVGEENANSQKELDKTVVLFYDVLDQVKKEANNLSPDDARAAAKLKVLQETSNHLAYYVGKVVLIRRMTGNYPLPQHTKEFLNNQHHYSALKIA